MWYMFSFITGPLVAWGIWEAGSYGPELSLCSWPFEADAVGAELRLELAAQQAIRLTTLLCTVQSACSRCASCPCHIACTTDWSPEPAPMSTAGGEVGSMRRLWSGKETQTCLKAQPLRCSGQDPMQNSSLAPSLMFWSGIESLRGRHTFGGGHLTGEDSGCRHFVYCGCFAVLLGLMKLSFAA